MENLDVSFGITSIFSGNPRSKRVMSEDASSNTSRELRLFSVSSRIVSP